MLDEPQSPTFEPGDRVRVRGGCTGGTVRAVVVTGACLVVCVDEEELPEVAPADGWEPEPVVLETGDDPDPCIVSTVPLAAVLTQFVTGWRRTRPMRGSGYRQREAGEVEPVSPLAWVAHETGLASKNGWSDSTLSRAFVQRPDGTVEARERYTHVEFRVADALVASIGEPGMYHDGTLDVTTNPRSCCGGSRPE